MGLISLSICIGSQAQNSVIRGKVSHQDNAITGASVIVLEGQLGGVSDEQGNYKIDGLKPGNYSLQASILGFKSSRKDIRIQPHQELVVDFTLEKDVLKLEDIVITATRNAVPAHRAPVMVNRIDERIFEQTQSLSIAEGLSFSPGLRLENNCQNCGFTQLRMNGLDGPYTQILINSRPVFSTLAGVYGLEMIPSNMVDRIEVVRGGGSALYGGNAIAGTVNIITKDPIENAFSFGSNLASIAGEAIDRTITANGSVVDEALKKGVSFYAFNRSRDQWDANGDGFSEITALKNTTFGMDAFLKINERNEINFNLFTVDEFRRGGNDFDLAPHQSDVAEQLEHSILGSSISFEHYSQNLKHKWSFYSSQTSVDRDSYYGGGGRVLRPQDVLTNEDLLAINAYGVSSDLSIASGVQYAYEISNKLMMTAGSEHQFNRVSDEMPGYGRAIDQTVQVLGNYGQLEWQVMEQWSFLIGGRYDFLSIDGLYELQEDRFNNVQQFGVFTPRASTLIHLQPKLKLRLAYAQGYRGPQAFDEDLHIETVGGAALFTRLDPELRTERSNSYNISLDYSGQAGLLEFNFVADAFLTQLENPFINSNQVELPNGISVITKRNGSAATVNGINLEANMAYSSTWMIQAGATIQSAFYEKKEEIWAPESLADNNRDSIISTDQILRTPNHYGYLSLNYTPTSPFECSVSAIYTGSMTVPHVINPDNEYTILETTPDFLELNFKASYEWQLSEKFYVDLSAGIQNILDNYQQDFDLGARRDAGYVYGPLRPRTYFLALKFHFEGK